MHPMVKKKAISTRLIILTRKLLATWLIMLLVLVTSMNFFVYNPSSSIANKVESATNDRSEKESKNLPDPTGPDEKSPNTSISLNEEYVHEHDEVINPYLKNRAPYRIAGAEKLHVVHSEILLPPPKHA